MRVLPLFVLVAACSSGANEPAPRPPTPKPAVIHDAGVKGGLVAPGLRLPDGVTPLAYDVRLDLDPERIDFGGHVAIRVRIAAPTDTVWIHADELQLERGTFTAGTQRGALAFPAVADAQEMIALVFPIRVSGEVTIELDYAGHVVDDLEGLFRQRAGGRWFLYSQAEATYARRILPCFDEPRFKVPWRVTLSVPVGQVALANAPAVADRVVGNRHEVAFAEIEALPAHLFAVAVGPFTLVNLGKLGKRGVPARIAVAAKDAKRAGAAATWMPKLVDALEQYFDEPLPLAKLDLVTVPRFFGAMENPGLITFEANALVGNEQDPVFLRRHIRFTAHELAHQWLGNAVTPTWWNDLWLAEAFATWLDDKLASALGPLDDDALRTQLARAHALSADREVGAKPIRRPIATNDDIEDAFDAISYEKGAAVIAMFEDYLGADRWRDVMRAYLKKGGNATAQDFLAAIPDAALARSFASYLDHPGVPIVDLAIDCTKGARVIATPRDGTSVPLCIRHPGGRVCALATGTTAIPLASCPAWVVGNAEGRGYYHAQWKTPPAAPFNAAERIAYGEDRAAAVVRGEVLDPTREIDTLVANHDPYGELAALAIAGEVDRALVDDAARGKWIAHLVSTFSRRLSKGAVWNAKSPADIALRDALTTLLPPDRFPRDTVERGRQIVELALANGVVFGRDFALAVALAAPTGGKPLFDRLVAAAAKNPRDEWFDALGTFDASFAPRAVDLVLDTRFEHDQAFAALAGMFARPATRVAAWRAVRPRLGELLSVLGASDGKLLVDATASLCDQQSRNEVVADLAPRVTTLLDGKPKLERSLAAIDRCIRVSGALRGSTAP